MIDFGTSFSYDQLVQRTSMTTPEYLPPDVLAFLDNHNPNELGYIMKCPHAYDSWSFGIILLEIVVGFPVYMAYKGRVVSSTHQSSM